MPFLSILDAKNALISPILGPEASLLDAHQLLLNTAGDPCFAGGRNHVDLAAHTELGQVDAGLDRKAGVRQDAADVVSF